MIEAETLAEKKRLGMTTKETLFDEAQTVNKEREYSSRVRGNHHEEDEEGD